jgi:hypothetical protein
MVLVLGGCSYGSGPPIRIIVPRDYQGEFLIVESNEGADIPMHKGEYVCLIPKDGKLLVRSLSPFHRWHAQSIVFDDGTIPKTYDHPAQAYPGDFAVFGGGIRSTGHSSPEMQFFVGTAKEAARALELPPAQASRRTEGESRP